VRGEGGPGLATGNFDEPFDIRNICIIVPPNSDCLAIFFGIVNCLRARA